MSSGPFDASRLQQPRFAQVADLVARFSSAADWPSVAALDEAFSPELRSVGMRLVEAGKTKPTLRADGTIDPASLYEVRIVDDGEIPTRPRNAHDLLNALIWAAFPQSKLALSRALAVIQRARAAGRAQLPATRTRDHDRLAMIDEGGLMRVRDGETTATWIFGHAIYEHAYAGELAVRGSAIDLEVPGASGRPLADARAAIDAVFAVVDMPAAVRSGPGIAVD